MRKIHLQIVTKFVANEVEIWNGLDEINSDVVVSKVDFELLRNIKE